MTENWVSDDAPLEENIHKGLVGIYVDQTDISYIDGAHGRLFYRGYNIKDLVEHSTFEEVVFLLLFGMLPSKAELDDFKAKLLANRDIPDNVLSLLKSFPRNTTRIELLRTAVSALSLYDPDDYDYSEKANMRKGIRIIAKIPTLIAYAHRIESNLPLIEPKEEYALGENYYYMMTGEEPTPEIANAFDKILLTHAEHSSNASTFSARVTISTLSDIYSGVVSAIGTLRGPLHGGANERLIRALLDEVKTEDNVVPWAEGKLERKEKIMGFGHRVYKTYDPRGLILREISKGFWDRIDAGEYELKQPETDVGNLLRMVDILVDYMVTNKGLYPNVDCYSGTLLYALAVPPPLYTPFFAAARSAGWVAHMIEQLRDNKLIRPLLKYTGELDREFLDLESREQKFENCIENFCGIF
jgi:citrate synthase